MNNINLLPQEYTRQVNIKRYVTVGIILLILECLGAAYVAIMPLIELNTQTALRTKVERELNNKEFIEVKEVNKALDQAQKDVEAWENNLSTMEKKPFVSGGLLDNLFSTVPLGVTIDTLDIQEEAQKIAITGRTTNHFAVLGYISHLQGLYPKANTTFEIGEEDKESIYRTFNVGLELPKLNEEQGNTEQIQQTEQTQQNPESEETTSQEADEKNE